MSTKPAAAASTVYRLHFPCSFQRWKRIFFAFLSGKKKKSFPIRGRGGERGQVVPRFLTIAFFGLLCCCCLEHPYFRPSLYNAPLVGCPPCRPEIISFALFLHPSVRLSASRVNRRCSSSVPNDANREDSWFIKLYR